jgi:gluconate 2-dehydrogenase gamma chain
MLAILPPGSTLRTQTTSLTVPAPLFDTFNALCDHVVPADKRSGSASDAGVPGFLDYLASQNSEYKYKLLGGLTWVNAYARRKFGEAFADCTYTQQLALVDDIAYRRNAKNNPTLTPGVEFFGWLRPLVLSAFFTTSIGIADLQYMGNQTHGQWKGCPAVPGVSNATISASDEN